jgi:putative phage-type endonuclease
MDAQRLQERKSGLGGSDSPVVIGVSPWKTRLDLYRDKLGLVPDFTGNNQTARGTALEPLVRDIYQEETGRLVKVIPGMIEHPEKPFIRANVDGQVWMKDGNGKGPGVLEIKCPNLHTYLKIKREGVPEYAYIQDQHYLGVTGAKWGSLAIFCADMWELMWFDIDRDDDLIRRVFDEDELFWMNHVLAQVPPEEAPMVDLDLPTVGGELITLETPDWKKAADDLRLAKQIMDEAKELETQAKKKIQRLMEAAGSEVVEGAGIRAYWREQAGRKTLDKKAMQADGIDIAKYEKQGKPFRSFRPYFIKGSDEGL